jgi:polyadenylate-binding protein
MSTQVAQASNPTAQNTNASSTQFASLYVGDLVPEVTEDVLYQVFNTIGPVASIRVCRDSVTRRSLGYAYVNFHSVQDAERALETLNFSNIKGHPCRIMWSHRDPAVRRSTNSNVFVKNLDKNIDNKALHDTFGVFGNILSCKIAQDPDGKSRGFGFVHYENEEGAKLAIEKLNGMKIGTKTVFVGLFQKHAEREDGTPKQFTNVYMKHIPDSWDEDKVKSALEEFGPVTSFVVKIDPKGRRFAFANFEDFDQAKTCVDSLHGRDMRTDAEKAAHENLTQEEKDLLEEEKDDDLYTYQLYCTRAQNKSERQAELKSKFAASSANSSSASLKAPGSNNLYIKNLSETVDDDGLKAMFETFGEITSAKVMRDEKGESRMFGFVCFANPEDATRAVTDMHLKLVAGKPLYVGLHEKKEQRIERLQSRYRVPQGGMMQPGGAGMMMGGRQGGFPQPGMYGGMMGRGGMPGGPMGMRPQGVGAPMMAGGYPRPGGAAPGAAGYMMNTQMRPQPGMMGVNVPKPGMPRGPMPAGMMQPGAMRMMPQRPMPGAGAYQFNNQARNQMMPAPQMDVGAFDPSGPLTAAALAAAPPAVQKQMLGEKLFPAIARLQPELAGKITGMMLEMDNSELLILLESEQQLRFKVEEALRVLQG